jgi:GNAT superfamily N-acetyltransferase
MDYQQVNNQIAGLVPKEGTRVIRNADKNLRVDVEQVELLLSYTELSDAVATKHSQIIKGVKSGQKFAESRFFIFDSEPISLFDWLWIHPNIRGNGIGRALSRATIDELEQNSETIYSDIQNTKLVSVVIDQGFNQISHGGLQGMYVRD